MHHTVSVLFTTPQELNINTYSHGNGSTFQGNKEGRLTCVLYWLDSSGGTCYTHTMWYVAMMDGWRDGGMEGWMDTLLSYPEKKKAASELVHNILMSLQMQPVLSLFWIFFFSPSPFTLTPKFHHLVSSDRPQVQRASWHICTSAPQLCFKCTGAITLNLNHHQPLPNTHPNLQQTDGHSCVFGYRALCASNRRHPRNKTLNPAILFKNLRPTKWDTP